MLEAVSLFFLRPPGRARKCSKLSKGLRALRSWEPLRREKAGESRREPARAGESRREPAGSAERPLLSFWAVCVHTHPESSVCTHSLRIECVRILAGSISMTLRTRCARESACTPLNRVPIRIPGISISPGLRRYFKIVDLLIHPPIKIKYTIRYCTANLNRSIPFLYLGLSFGLFLRVVFLSCIRFVLRNKHFECENSAITIDLASRGFLERAC